MVEGVMVVTARRATEVPAIVIMATNNENDPDGTVDNVAVVAGLPMEHDSGSMIQQSVHDGDGELLMGQDKMVHSDHQNL